MCGCPDPTENDGRGAKLLTLGCCLDCIIYDTYIFFHHSLMIPKYDSHVISILHNMILMSFCDYTSTVVLYSLI